MNDTFLCCICGISRYRHDVVALPDFITEASVADWKKAIGENSYERAFRLENPLACVEHFEDTQFDARGETKVWKAPREMPAEEVRFVDNFFHDHGYSKLCKERREKTGGRINMEHVFCSVCSMEMQRKHMVAHAAEHCVRQLQLTQNPCRRHQPRKKPAAKSAEGQADTGKVNIRLMANCSDCIARHHRLKQESIKTQAAICFPLFTFRYIRETTSNSVNTRIIGIISANYMRTRFRLRGPLVRVPGPGEQDLEEMDCAKDEEVQLQTAKTPANETSSTKHIGEVFKETVDEEKPQFINFTEEKPRTSSLNLNLNIREKEKKPEAKLTPSKEKKPEGSHGLSEKSPAEKPVEQPQQTYEVYSTDPTASKRQLVLIPKNRGNQETSPTTLPTSANGKPLYFPVKVRKVLKVPRGVPKGKVKVETTSVNLRTIATTNAPMVTFMEPLKEPCKEQLKEPKPEPSPNGKRVITAKLLTDEVKPDKNAFNLVVGPKLEQMLKNRSKTISTEDLKEEEKKATLITPKKKKMAVSEEDMEVEEHNIFGDDMRWQNPTSSTPEKPQPPNGINMDEDPREIYWLSGPLKLRQTIMDRFSHCMHPSPRDMLELAEMTKSKYRIIYDNYEALRRHHHVKCERDDNCERIKHYFEQEMERTCTVVQREEIGDVLDEEFQKHCQTGTNFTVGHVHVFAEMTGFHPKTIRSRYSTVRQRYMEYTRHKQFVPKMRPAVKTLSDEEKNIVMMKEFDSDPFPNPQKYIELAKHLDLKYEAVQKFYNTQRVCHIAETGMYEDVAFLNKEKSETLWAIARKPRVINYEERVKLSIRLSVSYNTICYWLDNFVVKLHSATHKKL